MFLFILCRKFVKSKISRIKFTKTDFLLKIISFALFFANVDDFRQKWGRSGKFEQKTKREFGRRCRFLKSSQNRFRFKIPFFQFSELAALKNLRQNEDQKGIPLQMKALFSICIFGVACGAVYALVPEKNEPSFLVFTSQLLIVKIKSFRILIWIKKIFVRLFIAPRRIRLITNISIELTTSKIKLPSFERINLCG